MRTVGVTIAAAVAVAALAAVTAVWVGGIRVFEPGKVGAFVAFFAATWVLFAVVVLLLRRVPVRAAVVVILLGAVAVGGAAMAGPPNTSTDPARYAWDGIVQDAGISPYRYTPDSDALASLHPTWLFTEPTVHADGSLHCPRTFAVPPMHLITMHPSGDQLCTAINRANVPTIYPPTSELLFALVRAAVPASAAYWPMQLAGLLLMVATTALLLSGLRRSGLDPRWAALWAFCPMVAAEGVTNSHVDQLGVLLALAGVFAVAAGARWRGGILLGAAIAVKLIPAITVPAVLRRQPLKVIVGAVAAFAVLYVPYVATTGWDVLGYLPGYLTEEGYSSGSRFVLLGWLPPAATLAVALVLLAAVAVLVIVRSDPSAPWVGQLVMIGAYLLITSPRYPWYALLLIPFIAMSGRWEWIALPLVLEFHLIYGGNPVFAPSLVVAALVIAAVSVWRRRKPDLVGLRTPSGS